MTVAAIIALAEEVGAPAIAVDARLATERLDEARFVVAVAARPRTVARVHERFAGLRDAGVRCVLDPAPRRDLLLVERAADRRLGPRTLAIDPADPTTLDRAVAVVHQLARETGATRIERLADAHRRDLCRRLRFHILEHQRALVRPRSELDARLNALAIVRVLVENLLELRAHGQDAERTRFADWVAIERTKFVMRTKADALAALGARLADVEARHALRRTAATAVSEIVVELLAALWERLRVAAEDELAAAGRRLLAEVDTSLGDLGEHLPADATAGFDAVPIRGFARHLECPPSSTVIASLVDRMGLASKQRIERAARDEVSEALDAGSRRIARRALEHHDAGRSRMEARFCVGFEGACASVRRAAEVAGEAQAGGPDAMARARFRITQWAAALAELAQLDSAPTAAR